MAPEPDGSARRPAMARQLSDLSEQVNQLAAKVEALEQEHVAVADRTSAADAPGGGPVERCFPTLDGFVDLWLLPTFRRPLTPLGMGSWRWCPRWWDHPEAWLVFGALWDEWEANRLEQLGMIEFTRDVLQILPEVCGEHGPFARCRVPATGEGHQNQRHQHVPAAPVEPAPDGWWDNWWGKDPDQPDGDALRKLVYPGVEEFVRTLLLPTFRRDPNAVGVTRWNWCDRWWHHDEVVHHFMNLWYLFETRAPEGRLIEFVREVYYLLPHVHSDTGPMRECIPSGKPGGPKHVDLTIAPVVPGDAGGGRGQAGSDWAGRLVTAAQHREDPMVHLDHGQRFRRGTPVWCTT